MRVESWWSTRSESRQGPFRISRTAPDLHCRADRMCTRGPSTPRRRRGFVADRSSTSVQVRRYTESARMKANDPDLGPMVVRMVVERVAPRSAPKEQLADSSGSLTAYRRRSPRRCRVGMPVRGLTPPTRPGQPKSGQSPRWQSGLSPKLSLQDAGAAPGERPTPGRPLGAPRSWHQRRASPR